MFTFSGIREFTSANAIKTIVVGVNESVSCSISGIVEVQSVVVDWTVFNEFYGFSTSNAIYEFITPFNEGHQSWVTQYSAVTSTIDWIFGKVEVIGLSGDNEGVLVVNEGLGHNNVVSPNDNHGNSGIDQLVDIGKFGFGQHADDNICFRNVLKNGSSVFSTCIEVLTGNGDNRVSSPINESTSTGCIVFLLGNISSTASFIRSGQKG